MIKGFFNEKASVWDDTIAEKNVAKLEGVASMLDIGYGSRVLDVGTGTGVFLPYILDKIGANGYLAALDFAEEMLKKAKAKGFDGNISYVCADIMEAELESGTFDAVVCYSCFPHFQDKPGALGEIIRMLKTGGRLFICHTSSREAINKIHHGIPAVCNDVLSDADTMRQMLVVAGFTSIDVRDNSDSYFARAVKL